MELDDITLGEIEDIETYAGCSFRLIGEDTPEATRLRVGLAWIIKRRENKDFTIEDARNMTTNELTKLFGDAPEKKG